jgi:hypothetical protein
MLTFFPVNTLNTHSMKLTCIEKMDLCLLFSVMGYIMVTSILTKIHSGCDSFPHRGIIIVVSIFLLSIITMVTIIP